MGMSETNLRGKDTGEERVIKEINGAVKDFGESR